MNTVAVIGVGLLGGSLGAALKKRGLAGKILGVGHRQESLDIALEHKIIDEGFLDIEMACRDADMIILATPAAVVPAQLDQVRQVMKPDAVVTDVTSTKGVICNHVRSTWPQPFRFVGSHPMAGSEKYGPVHADPELYRGQVVLMEPCRGHAQDAWEKIRALWQALDSTIIEIEPDMHDKLLAYTSHLPHISAACLVLAADSCGMDISPALGGGFRDTTRIADGRATIWRDICLTNREAILASLTEMITRLETARNFVKNEDAAGLERFFQEAQDTRRRVLES